MRKPCNTPDCPNLTDTTRCTTCEGTHNQARNKRRTHYQGDYRRRAAQIKATATRCWLCNQPFKPGEPIQADHVTPTDPHSQLLPAHPRCNASRGNKPHNPPPPPA